MKSIIFFDVETTGLETTIDRIIQISLIKTDLSLNVLEKKKLMLSNCGVPIQKDAYKAHGINELDLVGLPTFAQYASKILSFLDSANYIAGYNIKRFDIQILYEEFARAGITWNPNPIIDPCVIFQNREKRNLEAAVLFYCGKEMDGAHDAENDVLATIEVLRWQINKYSFGKLYTQEGNGINNKVPIEDILISESRFDNEDKRLSWDGKIILGEDGKAKWGFGKWKDKDLREADIGYVNWFLTSDFPTQTKNILKSYLNQ